MRHKSISLCMIVKNEERHIKNCLESVKGKVDEVIIVDTGSTDNTIQIAQQYNAKVYNFSWVNDFSAARNFSLKYATSDYILILDADESLDENADLQKELQSELDFYLLRIKNYMSNEYVSYHQAIRLFKRNKNFVYVGRIHEHLNIDESLNLKSGQIDILIHHVGYTQKEYDDKNKNGRNLPLLLKAVKENPSGYNYFNLGMQYKVKGDYSKALDSYKKSFYLSKDKVYLSYLLNQMGDCLLHLKRYSEGIELITNSLTLFPDYTDLYFILGKLYEGKKYFKDAKYCYQKCIELGEVDNNQTLEGVGSYLSYMKLGELYYNEGKYAQALEMAYQAVISKKYYLPALVLYFKVTNTILISHTTLIENLKLIYPVHNLKDLKAILTCLYELRHPLLYHFINQFNVKLDLPVMAVSNQYHKNYKEAVILWKQDDNHLESNNKDILLLSLLLKDETLFNDWKGLSSLTSTERLFFSALIQRRSIPDIDLTDTMQEYLFFIGEKLILLNEIELFDYLFNQIIKTNINLKPFLVILDRNGFENLSIELLYKYVDDFEHDLDFIRFAGNKFLLNKDYENSIYCYQKSLLMDDHYLDYTGLTDVYKVIQDFEKLSILVNIMKSKFKDSIWIEYELIN